MNRFSPNELTDYEIDGVDREDYPDFCDAFIAEAWVGEHWLTDDELNYITETYPEWVNEAAFESLL